MSDLGDTLAASVSGPLVVRTLGKVTQASPLLVVLAGDASAAPALKRNAAYTPALNDVVMVDVIGGAVRVVAYKIVDS